MEIYNNVENKTKFVLFYFDQKVYCKYKLHNICVA